MLLTDVLIRFGLNTSSSNLIIALYQKQSIAINTSTGGFPRVFAVGFIRMRTNTAVSDI